MKLAPDTIVKFPWGRVVDVHSIGDYDIIEAQHYLNGKRHSFEDRSSFHTYVEGKATGWNFPTLDHALIGAITHRHDGHSSRATEYICRMILIPEKP